MSQTFMQKHNYHERGTFKIYHSFVFRQAHFQRSAGGTSTLASKSLFLKHKEVSTTWNFARTITRVSEHWEHCLCTQSLIKIKFFNNSRWQLYLRRAAVMADRKCRSPSATSQEGLRSGPPLLSFLWSRTRGSTLFCDFDASVRVPLHSVVIMLLHKGLTHTHSQIKPRLLFGESFTLIVKSIKQLWAFVCHLTLSKNMSKLISQNCYHKGRSSSLLAQDDFPSRLSHTLCINIHHWMTGFVDGQLSFAATKIVFMHNLYLS